MKSLDMVGVVGSKKFDSVDRKVGKRITFLRREEQRRIDELERLQGLQESFPNKRCEDCGKLLRDCECDE